MSRLHLPRPLLVLLAVAVVAATLYVNAINLWEAYGSGPPHYGRTTNMDKWTNPWPWLVAVDVLAVAVCLLLYRLGRRGRED